MRLERLWGVTSSAETRLGIRNDRTATLAKIEREYMTKLPVSARRIGRAPC
jgi:hypothetical protein